MSGFVLRPLVVADHFVDDEADELFAEIRIQIGLFRKLAQAHDLSLLAAGVRGGQVVPGLVGADGLGDPKAFRQHVDQGGVDIVDARTETGENGVGCGSVLGHREVR